MTVTLQFNSKAALARDEQRAARDMILPSAIAADYKEACETLAISERASAAHSRRILQTILQQQGYNQRDLAQQIDALLNDIDPAKAIPSSLRSTIDAIRNF